MRRILVADDDPGILDAMRSLLSLNYDVRTARDGEEALEMAERETVDLVVLDLLMPLLDGENALVKLRRSGFTGAVIVMSAHADRLGRTRPLGADDFLAKPFEFRELERMIERLLPRDPPKGNSGRNATSASRRSPTSTADDTARSSPAISHSPMPAHS